MLKYCYPFTLKITVQLVLSRVKCLDSREDVFGCGYLKVFLLLIDLLTE